MRDTCQLTTNSRYNLICYDNFAQYLVEPCNTRISELLLICMYYAVTSVHKLPFSQMAQRRQRKFVIKCSSVCRFLRRDSLNSEQNELRLPSKCIRFIAKQPEGVFSNCVNSMLLSGRLEIMCNYKATPELFVTA